MQNALESVRHFHAMMNAPISTDPKLLPCNRAAASTLAEQVSALATQAATNAPADGVLLSRAAMALEELSEWLTAHARDNLAAAAAAADAWADRAYVLFGDAVASGLPAAALFDEVHRSNMTKEPDSAGSGKAIKGPAYQPPDIRRILPLK